MTRRHLAGGLGSVRPELGDMKPPSPSGIRQGVSVIASVSSIASASANSGLDPADEHGMGDKKSKVIYLDG